MSEKVRNRLRPMGIMEIIDETVEIYKSNFLVLIGIAAVIYVPFGLLNYLIATPSVDFGKVDPALYRQLAFYYGLLIIFVLVLRPIATGVFSHCISEIYLGNKAGVFSSYNRILKYGLISKLLGANILVLVLLSSVFFVSIGFLSLAVPLIYNENIIALIFLILLVLIILFLDLLFYLRMVLIPPAIVVENCGSLASLSRSWNLTKGYALKIFAIMLIVFLVTSIVSGTILVPLTAMSIFSPKNAQPSPALNVISILASTLIDVVFAPFMSIVIVLLYYDARIRKEGFDLEILANDINTNREVTGYTTAPDLPQERTDYQIGSNPDHLQ